MNNGTVHPGKHTLVFSTQALEDTEMREVVASMKSGRLGTGSKVARFDLDFAAYKGSRQSIA